MAFATPPMRAPGPIASPIADRPGTLAVLAGHRQRLAIVSTRDKLCGIAAYTAALARQLDGLFEVTVLDLDQELLRARHPHIRRLGDAHIKAICRDLARFDAVNLQLEYGILGRSAKDVCRRFAWLAEAAPRLSVTFHSLGRPTVLPLGDLCRAVAAFRFRTANDIIAAFRRNRDLSFGIAGRLRRVGRRKPVAAIVHNRRDLAEIKNLHGLEKAFDHPLSFLSPAEVETVRARAARQQFSLLAPVTNSDILVGVFGFVNNYKGFDTVINALRYLPERYRVLIFGGVHPNEIEPQRSIHPYLETLMRATKVNAAAQPGERLHDIYSERRTSSHHRDLSDRIHFMGALRDEDFLSGMAICDAVVFPYLEVGQSSSGPLSLALELGCRIIASRTRTFLDFAAYHPDRIEFFDIGNYLELAQHLASPPQHEARRLPLRYNTDTNKAIYLAANSVPAEASPRSRRQSTKRAADNSDRRSAL